MTPNAYTYHRNRCQPTVDRIWQAAKNGKVSRRALADIFNQTGQNIDRRMETYRRYGYDLPEIADDRRKTGRPAKVQRSLKPYTLPERLDPDGCVALAVTLLTGAIEDVRAGRDVAEAVAFLWSDRAALFFDSAGVDRNWAMEELEAYLCD